MILRFILPIALIVISCNNYHFEKPQPIDVPDLTSFPKIFRGEWHNSTTGKYLITSNTFSWTWYDSVQVIDGIADPADTTAAARNGRYVRSLLFNKEKNRNDTIDHFIFHKGLIYEVSGERLSSGRPFKRKDNSIHFRIDSRIHVELRNQNNLRKLTENLYILNVCELNLPSEHPAQWFQVVLLERAGDGIRISFLDTTFDHLLTKLYSNADNWYVDVSWTREELINLTNKGLFDRVKNGIFQKVKSESK